MIDGSMIRLHEGYEWAGDLEMVGGGRERMVIGVATLVTIVRWLC